MTQPPQVDQAAREVSQLIYLAQGDLNSITMGAAYKVLVDGQGDLNIQVDEVHQAPSKDGYTGHFQIRKNLEKYFNTYCGLKQSSGTNFICQFAKLIRVSLFLD